MATPLTLGFGPKPITGITATASTAYPGWPASALFDGVIGGSGSSWSASTNTAAWVQAQLSIATAADTYQVIARTDAPNSAPSAWTFEGSNDGSTWTVLDTQTAQTWVNGQTSTYPITNTTSYLYYKLNMTATQGGGATWPSFTEWNICAGTVSTMIDWWKADAIAGVANGATLPATSIPDSSGNGQTFTSAVIQGVYRSNTGPNSMPFMDGSTTGGIAYTASNKVGPRADFTYFAVVKTGSTAIQNIVGSVANNGAEIRFSNFKIQCNADGVSGVAASTIATTANTWTIVIVSYTQATGAFYTNLSGATETVAGTAGVLFSSNQLNLGSYQSNSAVWQGGIAEVGRYKSVLSTSDKAALYTYLSTKYMIGVAPSAIQVESLYGETMTAAVSPPIVVESLYGETMTTTTPPVIIEAAYTEIMMQSVAIQQFIGWGTPI